jgi:DNA-binding NarL/FixJ family response regulator
LKLLVAGASDIGVAGEAADGHATLEMIRQREWGLVMLDLCMPGRSGLELIKMIKAERPRLPLLVFSGQREELYAVRAIRAGASGYLSLRADSETVVSAMRRVAGGRMFVSQRVTELVASHPAQNGSVLPHDRLTDREYGIFSRIVSGATLTDIAGELSLSIKTVSTHKSHILDKMTLGGQVELVRYAIEHKLLDTVRE